MRSSEDVKRLVAELQNLTCSMDSDTHTLIRISQAAKQASQVLKEAMLSTMQQHAPEVYVTTKTNIKHDGRHAESQLRIISLRRGEASNVDIDKHRSGPNALALCGDPIIQPGKDRVSNGANGNHTSIPLAGRCTGTSFTPYDFSGAGKSERLVIVVDNKVDTPHELFISANIQNVSQLVDVLHEQPWVRRSAADEDCAAAEEAAVALASHLRNHDPVDDGRLNDYVEPQCFGLWHKNMVPAPLQTNAIVRRERRFEAAVFVLNEEIKFRFSAHVESSSNFAAAMMLANRQRNQQLMLESALEATFAMQADIDAAAALDETADAVLDEALG